MAVRTYLSRFISSKKPPIPTRQQFQSAEYNITEIVKHLYSLEENPSTCNLMDYSRLIEDFKHLTLDMRGYSL